MVELSETVNIYVATVNGIPITDNGLDITIVSDDNSNADIIVEDGPEGGTTMATIDLGGKTLSSAIPSDALRLVLADGSTMNADVEIVTTDIVAGLKEASTVNVPIRLKDDDLVEGAETVVVELRIDSTIAPGLEDLLTVGTGSFMLADADSGEVRIAALSKTTYNEGDEVTFTVELPSGLTAGTNITVGYELIVTTTGEVGKAASAADIDGPTMGSVTINEGAGTAIITINLADDSVVEVAEQLGVRLTSASGASGVTFDATTTQLTINDNDTPAVTAMLSTAGLKVEEGQDASFMIRLSEMAAKDLEFRLTRIEEGSTAIEGEDYSLPALPIVVPVDERGVSVTISTLSDVAHEVDKTVRFALTPVSGTNVNLGTPSEILLEIEELFDAVLTFQTPSVEVRDEDLDTSVITEAGTYSETLRVVLRDASPMREVLQELPAEYQHLARSLLWPISTLWTMEAIPYRTWTVRLP